MSQSNRLDATRQLHRSHGSFELVMSPLLLALGGLWIDRTVGFTPWITIVAALLGLFGAGAKIYYQYNATMAELDETRAEVRRERIEGTALGESR